MEEMKTNDVDKNKNHCPPKGNPILRHFSNLNRLYIS